MTVTAEVIKQQINSDIHTCEELLTLFETEREALKDRDSDALDTVLQDKTSHLHKLEHSAVKRSEWSKELAQTQPGGNWEEMINSLTDSDIKTEWQTLKSLFTRCKEENEVNGRMIARNQQVIGRLVELLRGQTAAPNLYSAKGSRASTAGSNRFGEA